MLRRAAECQKLSEEKFLVRIETLKKVGQVDEVATALNQFTKQYPMNCTAWMMKLAWMQQCQNAAQEEVKAVFEDAVNNVDHKVTNAEVISSVCLEDRFICLVDEMKKKKQRIEIFLYKSALSY